MFYVLISLKLHLFFVGDGGNLPRNDTRFKQDQKLLHLLKVNHFWNYKQVSNPLLYDGTILTFIENLIINRGDVCHKYAFDPCINEL